MNLTLWASFFNGEAGEAIVVWFDPSRAPALARLGDMSHESEGAFYLLTSEVWFVREGRRLSIWRREGEKVREILATAVEGEPCTAKVVLLVDSVDVMTTLEVFGGLDAGDLWPMVVGPRDEPQDGK